MLLHVYMYGSIGKVHCTYVVYYTTHFLYYRLRVCVHIMLNYFNFFLNKLVSVYVNLRKGIGATTVTVPRTHFNMFLFVQHRYPVTLM